LFIVSQRIEVPMRIKHIVVTVLLLPSLALAQNDDAIEMAKLGIIEKMYEGSAEHFRQQLDACSLSDREIEDILFEAFDAYALCSALAAQAQAHEQGLSKEIILKGIGHRTRGKEESLILLALDMDALKIKGAPCKKAFGEKLGVIIL
jgi:hypothetical protein